MILARTARERADAAIHEAGHAIAAEALRPGSVRLVTIVPSRHEGRHEGGHVIYTDTGPLAERAMVSLAGRQALAQHGWLDDDSESGCGHDLEQAKACALKLAGGDEARAEEVLVDLRARTRELLFEHSLLVSEVAIALLELGELAGDQLRAVIRIEQRRTAGLVISGVPIDGRQFVP